MEKLKYWWPKTLETGNRQGTGDGSKGQETAKLEELSSCTLPRDDGETTGESSANQLKIQQSHIMRWDDIMEFLNWEVNQAGS